MICFNDFSYTLINEIFKSPLLQTSTKVLGKGAH
jgi:hypothetical protein